MNYSKIDERFDKRWSGDEVPEYQMFCKPDEKVGCGSSRDRIKDFWHQEFSNLLREVLEKMPKEKYIPTKNFTSLAGENIGFNHGVDKSKQVIKDILGE